MPLKYRLLGNRSDVRFVTWLRDPVERLASNYCHWKSAEKAEHAWPLWQKCLDEQWSLERFCFCPELQDIYSQFLWGFPLHRFAFIGITEHFSEDLAFFSNTFLGAPAAEYHANVGSEAGRPTYVTDRELRRAIESFHKRDVALYRRAVEMRRSRLLQTSPEEKEPVMR